MIFIKATDMHDLKMQLHHMHLEPKISRNLFASTANTLKYKELNCELHNGIVITVPTKHKGKDIIISYSDE